MPDIGTGVVRKPHCKLKLRLIRCLREKFMEGLSLTECLGSNQNNLNDATSEEDDQARRLSPSHDFRMPATGLVEGLRGRSFCVALPPQCEDAVRTFPGPLGRVLPTVRTECEPFLVEGLLEELPLQVMVLQGHRWVWPGDDWGSSPCGVSPHRRFHRHVRGANSGG